MVTPVAPAPRPAAARPATAHPGAAGALARRPADIHRVLADLERPCYVVQDAAGLGVTGDERVAAAAGRVLAAVGPLPPERLGAPAFRRDHQVAQAYMAGSMANGIASADLVVALARAGFLASFGAAGVVAARVDDALADIRRRAPGLAFGCNLIHSPTEAAMERDVVDACLRHQVRCVEASAFLDLTPQVVRYRIAGLRRGPDGRVVADNRVVAKVSRTEVAELFLRPAPAALVRPLVEQGLVSAEQAELAATVAMADDITGEADSGGHTDRRPLPVLLPELLALRDSLRRDSGARTVRIGAAGGLGTPRAVAAAFTLGADYVVTGSVNQASVEAAQSPATKTLLAQAGVTDCVQAPSADMFEIGADVQVLGRGTMFASKARRLYDLYRRFDGLDEIPADERAGLEQRIFRRSLDEVWADTVTFFSTRDPEQIERARESPKRRMALVFRWYLGLSSGWSITGVPDRVADYQIWCGPAMGAFNTWVRASALEPLANRHAAVIAAELMRGAAFTSRAAALAQAGVRLPALATTYVPRPHLPRPDSDPGEQAP
ncbi:PfaD family polyunsaturated fatty acid/polyketide biosynthesis protein [Parafrankia sp. BMG5.11]|uniref:PfaD family polyunsaturated fatty acid/polyketide biosynthesis protein n=1 Tax=Parafrankia sp. BMG5.11 TaxID=222540 RepID=UPI00103F6E5B|nr:PfaD family polyunsaturated fatty acid/polyketide biosynthesis protein [Parafrankia sp. BMG5.11]TCJ31940.1 PfaD family polyunsaturated fatty acid/polyketide biosynthesis protein [Parafrankia sp. BMG5.11]